MTFVAQCTPKRSWVIRVGVLKSCKKEELWRRRPVQISVGALVGHVARSATWLPTMPRCLILLMTRRGQPQEAGTQIDGTSAEQTNQVTSHEVFITRTSMHWQHRFLTKMLHALQPIDLCPF